MFNFVYHFFNLGAGGGAMGPGSRELNKHSMNILCGRWVVGAFSLQTKPLEPEMKSSSLVPGGFLPVNVLNTTVFSSSCCF